LPKVDRLAPKIYLTFNQLQNDHFSRVAVPWTQLEHTSVTTRPIGIANGDILEQLLHCFGIANPSRSQAAGVHHLGIAGLIASLRQRDQTLSVATNRGRLGVRGANPLVLEQLFYHRAAQSRPLIFGTT
jgi:hypothetical protein